MKKLAAGILLTCMLTSCETTRPSGDQEDQGFAAVAGTWRFSHFGTPTIRNEALPDPGKEMKKHLSGTTISIDKTGATSTVAPGHAASYQMVVREETPLYIKMAGPDQPIEEALVYDKTQNLMMISSKLTIDGEHGVIPTYFKRTN